MNTKGTLRHVQRHAPIPRDRVPRRGQRRPLVGGPLFRAFASAAVTSLALTACGSGTSGPDVGAGYDARAGFTEDPTGDPLPTPTGVLQLRLANMLVAGPNLTICISTIPGTGVTETSGHMIGTVDMARGLDGTLPYPGVSPYISFPTYASPGFAVMVRLYDRADVPFAALGAPCPAAGSVEPVVSAPVVTADAAARTTLVAMGVVPGAPVSCGMAECPAPMAVLFADDPTPGAGGRVRVVHTIPNLPAPIHVCFDPDFVDPTSTGTIPSVRVVPPAEDVNGLSFGESSPFLDVPALSSTPGAFFVHLTVPGPPDCSPATLALGPITLPFPVPETAPADVARTIDVGDVISLFAFGRLGSVCADDSTCAPLGGTCNTTRHLCQDVLSPSVLPWQDVMGM
ncbi:MAG: hypothetical protein U0353_21110 [Sandaracinus sp.]